MTQDIHTTRKESVRSSIIIYINRSFTLVELLIVITVMCLLSALLLPCLNKGIESARSLACSNNLKDIGLGMHAYATDNCGFFPFRDYWNSPVKYYFGWTLSAGRYVAKNSFLCPGTGIQSQTPSCIQGYTDGASDYAVDATSTSSASPSWGGWMYTYGYNYQTCGVASVTGIITALRFNRVVKPANLILLVDSALYSTGRPFYSSYPFFSDNGAYPQHQFFCNVVWSDGHTTAVNAIACGIEGAQFLYRSDGPLKNKWEQNSPWNN